MQTDSSLPATECAGHQAVGWDHSDPSLGVCPAAEKNQTMTGSKGEETSELGFVKDA